MKKLHFKAFVILMIIMVSCSKEETHFEEEKNQEVYPDTPLTIDQINDKITETLNTTGDFDWSKVDPHFLWSAIIHGDNILTIGYGDEGESFSDAENKQISSKKDEVLAVVAQTEKSKVAELTTVAHEIINVVDVGIQNINTIIALRKHKYVRYLEPNGYNHYKGKENFRSSSGCNENSATINPAHYTTIAPNNAQVSWNFNNHNIPQAWNISTGAGVTIGLIDTGLSESQILLNSSGFNDGYSSGRTVQKYGTFIDSGWWWSSNYDGPHDKCGHGTAMGSAMASPRNDNGMPVGVAYNANLVAYRATEDVLLDDYHERKGVSDALTQLGRRSDVKIISMSIGYVWSIGNIKDAVKYAYSKNKLIFAAGGTSTTFTNGFGVIFPATMEETVAVTGVDDGNNYERCETCHSGSKIDFTIIMEGDNDTSKSPPVLGFYNGARNYTGGSSVATATTAGIAALVWSRYPNWSREQVLGRLKQASDFYPNKNSDFGYGNIDALKAVQ